MVERGKSTEVKLGLGLVFSFRVMVRLRLRLSQLTSHYLLALTLESRRVTRALTLTPS